MKNKYTFIFTFFLLSFIACNSISENNAINDNEDSLQYYPVTPSKMEKEEFRYYYRAIQSFYDTYLSRSGFSGSILVAKNGKVLFEKYSGYADYQKKDSIHANTPLHLASTSKTFTAMAILQLAKNNKLDIDDPVKKYIDSFPYPDVSIKMLLNHRSGLPNYLYFIEPRKFKLNYKLSNQEVLDYLIENKVPLSYKPDTRFNYCNTNFVLLALIIEKVTQQPYPEFLKTNFFEPLGMTNTFINTHYDSVPITKSYYPNWKPWTLDNFDGTYGDKNIYSTAQDLLKWSAAIMNKQTFSTPLLDSAFKPYSNEKKSQHNYGLGWRLLSFDGSKKIIYHHGKWHGSNSFFAILPEENVVIIIVGNKYNRNVYKGNLLYDVFGNYMQDKEAAHQNNDNMDGGMPK